MWQSIDLETSLAATFYFILSLWWFLSITVKYASCIRGNTEYHSGVTYPCCGMLRKLPVEGAVKFISATAIAVLSAIKCFKNCDESRKLSEITIFVIFACSGLCDILTQKCQRYMFSSIDYFILMFAFLLQSIVSACHTDLMTSSLAVADDCMMFAAAGAALAVLLEFKFTDVLSFSLLRSFCTLVMGTWSFHIAFILKSIEDFGNIYEVSVNMTSAERLGAVSNSTTFTEILQNADSAYPGDHILLIPMYFSWHCFLNMAALTGLWLSLYKCSNKPSCRHLCSCNEEEIESQFEHHIHFDYHIIDRLDSDME